MTETTSTDGDLAQHLSQSDDDGVLSTVSGGAPSRQSPPQQLPGTPSSGRSQAARLDLLNSIADSDVPYANALYSTEGVVIKYVIRFVDTHGVRWCVEKRYSDILPLHDALKEAYERTRSIGVKLSSFLSSSRESAAGASRGARAAERQSSDENRVRRQRDSVGSSGGNSDGATGQLHSSNDTSGGGSSAHSRAYNNSNNNNSRSALPFPKFPGKALSKATNTSIKFILRRRLELSHYFSALLSGGIDRFVKSVEAKQALLQFVNHPALSTQSSMSSFAAATAGVAPSSESAYCFKENDDGFVSVEQKTFVYAYFTVPTNSRICPVAEWLKAAVGAGSTASARGSSMSGEDDIRVAPSVTSKAQHRDPRATAGLSTADYHVSQYTATPPRSSTAPPRASSATGTAVDGGDGTANTGVDDAAGGGSQSPLPVEPTRSADSRHSATTNKTEPRQLHSTRVASLERNQSVNSYIPTLTISLPYARIVFDLNDSSRVVIALRCERLEGRPEIVRRRDELLAFYRHIAHGSVDRLPDVHEAKRFFVNYRRDNPLQEIGTALKLPVGAEYRDRLPEDTPPGRSSPSATGSSVSAQRHHHGASPLEEFSDVEDNLDRDEHGDDDDDDEHNNGSIVISLASLKSATAAASAARELRRSLTSERSAAALRFGGAASPSSSDAARQSCSNSHHFVTTTTTTRVITEVNSPLRASESQEAGARTTTVETWPVNNCRCTSEAFCYNYGSAAVVSQAADEALSRTPTDAGSPTRVVAVTRVAAFQSANGFQINIHQPPSGNHKRPRKLSCQESTASSATPQSRQ